MILIYEAKNADLTKNGLGALAPAVCYVTEVINGGFELVMNHPIDEDGKWERLKEERILRVPTHRGNQYFRIYAAVKNPITGYIDVNARHISYDLLDNMLEDVRPTAKTGQEAGQAMLAGCQYATPFTFTSDITAVSTAYYIRMNPIEAFIGSDDQSFINRWGGEIIRDNYDIAINSRMGSDKGVRIAYGKNLTGLEATVDISGVCTRIMPIAQDENGAVITTPQKYYDSPLINNYAHPKIGVLKTGIRVGKKVNGEVPYPDLASAYNAMEAQVQAAWDSGADMPTVSMDVSFVDWSDTDEYKAFASLCSVELGDDVVVDYLPLDINVNLRATEIEWDCILNKANNVVLGDKLVNAAQTVVDMDIDLTVLGNDIMNKLEENEAYNNVTITHEKGIVTSATIGGVAVEVRQNAQEGFALYAGGDYVGGLKVVDGKAVLVSNILTDDVDGDCYIEIGEFEEGGLTYKGINIYDKDNSETEPSARVTTRGGFVYIDNAEGARIILSSGLNVTDGNGRARILISDDALNDIIIYDRLGNIAFGHLYGSRTYMTYGNNTVGVDSGGVYKQIGATKTYL